MKITIDDINFHIYGFICEKITKATNKQFEKLEELLTEQIQSVNWSNIDDLGCLTVSWLGMNGCYKQEEKEIVCDILNKVFKIK